MKTLWKLSDDELLISTQDLVQREREVTLEILHHFREVEKRQLFAKRGYSSLFDYATKELKYSAGAAQRRIDGMRLLKVLPELEVKLQDGTLPLSTLAQAQTFFRHEEIVDAEEKREVMKTLEGKSSREVEKIFAARSPEFAHRESCRAVAENVNLISFTVDDELLAEMNELKELLSHRNPSLETKGLVRILVKEGLKKHRKKCHFRRRYQAKPKSSAKCGSATKANALSKIAGKSTSSSSTT